MNDIIGCLYEVDRGMISDDAEGSVRYHSAIDQATNIITQHGLHSISVKLGQPENSPSCIRGLADTVFIIGDLYIMQFCA